MSSAKDSGGKGKVPDTEKPVKNEEEEEETKHPVEALLDSVAEKLLRVETELAESERLYRRVDIQRHKDEAMKILNEVQDELNEYENAAAHPFPEKYWAHYWELDIEFSPSFLKMLRKHKVAMHPFITMMIQDRKVEVLQRKVKLLEKDLIEVKSLLPTHDSLQLGSVAFELEKLALTSIGGNYMAGFDKTLQDGTVERVYFNTFNNVDNDYQYNKMTDAEKTKYEKFLTSIVPNWGGSLGLLSTRLNHSVTKFKDQRVKDAHPAIDSTRLKDLKKLAVDPDMFDYMTAFLASRGKIS